MLLTNSRLTIIIGIVLLVFLMRRLGPTMISRLKSQTMLPHGAAPDRGIAGGLVCPKCHQPFPQGLTLIPTGFGAKIVRCNFCGKWSFMRRLDLAELQAAEEAELEEAESTQTAAGKKE
jgi:hypothetical protein